MFKPGDKVKIRDDLPVKETLERLLESESVVIRVEEDGWVFLAQKPGSSECADEPIGIRPSWLAKLGSKEE